MAKSNCSPRPDRSIYVAGCLFAAWGTSTLAPPVERQDLRCSCCWRGTG